MPDVKFTLSIGFANCRQEEVVSIDDDEWSECETDEDRDALMEKYWKDWSNNYIDGGFEVIE